MSNLWAELVAIIAWLILLKINLLLPFVSSSSSSTTDSIEKGRWNPSLDGQILWRNDCKFDFSYVFSYAVKEPVLTADECGKHCLNRPMTCNHFIFSSFHSSSEGNCDLLWATKAMKQLEVNDESIKRLTCGYIQSQVWPKSENDDQILVKFNCTFQSTASGERKPANSFHSCKSYCLEDHLCSAFSYSEKKKLCIMPHITNIAEKTSSPWILADLFRLNIVNVSSSDSCAIVSSRSWKQHDVSTFYQYNCDFKNVGIIGLHQNKRRENCISQCSNNPNCTHFSFHNETCYLKNLPLLTADRMEVEGVTCGYIPDKIKWNFTTIDGWVIRWKEECEFNAIRGFEANTTSAEDCRKKCVKLATCNHFSHDGFTCYLIFNFQLSELTKINGKQWTCGYVPKRIWHKALDEKRILMKTECAFPSSSYNVITSLLSSCQNICLNDHLCNAFSYNSTDGKCFLPHKKSEFETTIISFSNLTQLFRFAGRLDVDSRTECGFIPTRNWNIDLIGPADDGVLYQENCDFNNEFDIQEPQNQSSLNDCIDHCFNFTRCTHFTYKTNNKMCSVKKASVFVDRLTAGGDQHCGYIPSRWDLTENNTQQNVSTDWISERMADWVIGLISLAPIIAIVILLVVPVVAVYKYKKIRATAANVNVEHLRLKKLLEGDPNAVDPDKPLDEQTRHLPYDNKCWEFQRDQLKLGKELGSGAFGRVVKGQAIGLKLDEPVTTVAVKMVRSTEDTEAEAALRSLVGELKIMMHLGSHLNIVSLMGACTDISKGDFLVLVEYCRFGNLRTYLKDHRDDFVNLIDSTGNWNPKKSGRQQITSVGTDFPQQESADGYLVPRCDGKNYQSQIIIELNNREGQGYDDSTPGHEPALQHHEISSLCQSEKSSCFPLEAVGDPSLQQSTADENMKVNIATHSYSKEEINDDDDGSPDWSLNYKSDADQGATRNNSFSTRDLINWSLQIARGMDYLASKKVLHGDLAARNVLLADDGVVKVADFGLARQLYNDYHYKKQGRGMLPVKWMAIESLTDWTFSSQSDVWSFGVVLWEIFSLGKVPYPGMQFHQLIALLLSGYRMEKPELMPQDIGRLMAFCWKPEPRHRPTFHQLANLLCAKLEN